MFRKPERKITSPEIPPQPKNSWNFYDDKGKVIERPVRIEDDKETSCCGFRKKK